MRHCRVIFGRQLSSSLPRGRKEIVDILLRANARVDEADVSGRTACHAAVDVIGLHNHDVLALLLARQPNLAAIDVKGRTAFYRAVEFCQNDCGRAAVMLLDAGASPDSADPSDLCYFAGTSTAAVQALLDRGVVVRELRDSNGFTPLHVAAWNSDIDDTDVFDMLVDVCGIDLEALDHGGETCLHVAARRRHFRALRWILKAGVDVDYAASNGSTPLHVADFNCVGFLLAAGANVSARDNRGRTALHDVSRTNVCALLAGGADLDAADDAGETARQALARLGLTVRPCEVQAEHRNIAKARLNLVRDRALQVCIGLQSLRLDALQMCEILQHTCLSGRVAQLVPFHIWWKIATTVKHFPNKLNSINETKRTSFHLRQLAQMTKERRVRKRSTAQRAKVARIEQYHTKRRGQLGRVDASGKLQRTAAQRHLLDARDARATQHMVDKLVREQELQLFLKLARDGLNRALRQPARHALKHVDVWLRVAGAVGVAHEQHQVNNGNRALGEIDDSRRTPLDIVLGHRPAEFLSLTDTHLRYPQVVPNCECRRLLGSSETNLIFRVISGLLCTRVGGAHDGGVTVNGRRDQWSARRWRQCQTSARDTAPADFKHSHLTDCQDAFLHLATTSPAHFVVSATVTLQDTAGRRSTTPLWCVE
jgi:ankyrin repeat protein